PADQVRLERTEAQAISGKENSALHRVTWTHGRPARLRSPDHHIVRDGGSGASDCMHECGEFAAGARSGSPTGIRHSNGIRCQPGENGPAVADRIPLVRRWRRRVWTLAWHLADAHPHA